MGTARNIEGTDSPAETGSDATCPAGVPGENAAITEVIPEEAYKQNHIYRLLVNPTSGKGEPG